MGRWFSLYLDGLRLLGALMVLFAHWAFPRFTGSDHMWMRHHDLGGDGVVIFFVLSGLLIAYTAEKRRDEGISLFAADRLSRLWSVALPALVFCYALDVIGHAIGPDIYAIFGYQGGISWQSLVTGATFTNELWFVSAQPGSNGPYWSLGYAAWYYAIFAAFFFAPKAWRWGWVALLALIAGPKIWLLAPSWLFGVWIWRAIASGRLESLSKLTAWTMAVAPVALYFMLHAQSFHWQLHAQTEMLLGADVMGMLRHSDTFAWSFILGILTSLHILGVAALLQSREVSDSPIAGETSIRWLAGGSFALYLVHFPVMHFMAAILPGGVEAVWRQAAVLIAPCVIAYLFAEITERRRPALRKWLRDYAQKENRRHVPVTAAQ
ncbi:MAG: acyltransferase [Henriciella sp.]|nr:acyltransferase [Henriciella sp.]